MQRLPAWATSFNRNSYSQRQDKSPILHLNALGLRLSIRCPLNLENHLRSRSHSTLMFRSQRDLLEIHIAYAAAHWTVNEAEALHRIVGLDNALPDSSVFEFA